MIDDAASLNSWSSSDASILSAGGVSEDLAAGFSFGVGCDSKVMSGCSGVTITGAGDSMMESSADSISGCMSA